MRLGASFSVNDEIGSSMDAVLKWLAGIPILRFMEFFPSLINTRIAV